MIEWLLWGPLACAYTYAWMKLDNKANGANWDVRHLLAYSVGCLVLGPVAAVLAGIVLIWAMLVYSSVSMKLIDDFLNKEL